MQAILALMNASRDQCILLDRDGYIHFINKSAADFLGKTPDEIEGTLYWECLSPEYAQTCKERMEAVLYSGEPEMFSVHVGERMLEVFFNPVTEQSGEVNYIANFTRDTTSQVKAEQELVASESRHRRLFHENPVPMYVYDTQTLKILDANTALIESYGYSRDELTAMTISDIRPREDVSRVMENVTDLKSKQVYLGTWRHTKKDGSIIDVEITSGDFPYEDKPARLVLCHDVTEKISTQRALEDQEEQYRHLFEENPLPMMIVDIDTLRFINVNTAAINHYGYKKEEFLNFSVMDIRPPEDVEIAREAINSMKSPVEKMGVFRHRKKDGTIILVDIVSHEIVYEGSRARLVLCNDVSDQVHARKALEESEAKFRSVVESSPMGLHMYSLDEQGRLIFAGANPAADNILRIDHKKLIGLTLEEAFPGAVSTEIPNRYREVCLTGKPWRSEEVNYQDDEISGAFEVHAFQTGHRLMSVLFLDITAKKKAQQEITDSEEKFRKAFITNPDPMTISEIEDAVFLEVNEGFIDATGYSREECLGKSSFDINLWADEGQRDEIITRLKRDGELVNFEADIRTKDGTVKTALISASIINLGSVPRMLTISRDITELKRAENALLKSEEQLRASLGEKEMLLKEIHHRVKNNLQVISGLLDLQANHIHDSMGREIYRESQNRVITMALIHEELYQSVNLSRVDFADYIRNLCKNLFISYGADKNQIKLDIKAEKTEMVVDTAIPCGLIINELITNSLKHAFPDKRKGTISLSFRQMRNKKFLLIVNDDGVGIPGDVDLSSTNTLGIQLVTAMVEQLGGTLKIKRRGGTSFTIKFSEYHEAGSIMY